MEAQLRIRVARHADVRIALVVAKQDVVARLERLDEVVLEQQRLALGAHGRRLDARDLRDHRGDARLVAALLEIARDALLQVARLADVERAAGGVEHPVHAGQMRQRRDAARARRTACAAASASTVRRLMRETFVMRCSGSRGRDGRRSGRTPTRNIAARQPAGVGVVAAAMIAVEQRGAVSSACRAPCANGWLPTARAECDAAPRHARCARAPAPRRLRAASRGPRPGNRCTCALRAGVGLFCGGRHFTELVIRQSTSVNGSSIVRDIGDDA